MFQLIYWTNRNISLHFLLNFYFNSEEINSLFRRGNITEKLVKVIKRVNHILKIEYLSVRIADSKNTRKWI